MLLIATVENKKSLRDRPFNLRGGAYSFLFRSEIFSSDNTRVRIFIFFVHQNQNIFFSNIGNQNIFFRKNHNPVAAELFAESFIKSKSFN